MPFDFKKEYPALYRPSETPSLVDVPAMRFLAVRGEGNPTDPDGHTRALSTSYTALPIRSR